MKNLLDNLLSPVSRLLPRRIRLFYVILIVLLLLSVVPLAIFRWWVGSSTRERVETIQRHRQTTVTRGIAADISGDLRSAERQIESLERMLELRGAIYDVAAPQHAGTIDGAIESFVGPAENLLFVTVVNPRQRGRQGGVPEIGQDDFVQQRLRDGFQRAQLNQGFNSGAFLVHAGSEDVPVMVMARPLAVGNDFRGMVATVVSLQFLRERLQESSEGGLDIYVVDRNGRLIIHSNERDFHVGQDMTSIRIVQRFLEGTARATLNTEFDLTENGRTVRMLGSQSPVRGLDWAVIAQDEIDNAYAAVRELETLAISLLVVAMLLSVGIGYYSARRLTTPIEILAQTTRAIAKGDFSRRVNLPSRTEIGELADTFNVMTDDLEKYIEQLKQAAQENHELFLGSIRTLAAAIDEKDPYTRGHSGRVSKYSVILAEHMALEDEEVYKIRISALLHDVGKIGIDDRILKKPAGLTDEEFEVMKQHPVKGANIIRPVAKLREMIPGIELHHESLDGKGYPYGLKGEEIPRMARVIMVADTLDAMTTNRPYQAAMELETAMEKIRALEVKKFDPEVVEALFKAAEGKRLKLTPAMVEV